MQQTEMGKVKGTEDKWENMSFRDKTKQAGLVKVEDFENYFSDITNNENDVDPMYLVRVFKN